MGGWFEPAAHGFLKSDRHTGFLHISAVQLAPRWVPSIVCFRRKRFFALNVSSKPYARGRYKAFRWHHYTRLYSKKLGFGGNVVGIKENVIAQSAPALKKAEKTRLLQSMGKYEQIVTTD